MCTVLSFSALICSRKMTSRLMVPRPTERRLPSSTDGRFVILDEKSKDPPSEESSSDNDSCDNVQFSKSKYYNNNLWSLIVTLILLWRFSLLKSDWGSWRLHGSRQGVRSSFMVLFWKSFTFYVVIIAFYFYFNKNVIVKK